VLKKMSDSVIEIDIDEEEDVRLYFKRFFCALGPCLEEFCEGCSPYLIIDFTTLNERWNDHLPSATVMDGHNWIFSVAFGFSRVNQKIVGLGSCYSYARPLDNRLLL
jgi:hypothetical protein